MNHQVDKDLLRDIKNYRDTKSISHNLVHFAKHNKVDLSSTIYRGDCMYPSLLQIGKPFKFHNHVSSWSLNKDIALIFANTDSAPDWYFMEDEWCNDYTYPFKKANDNKEELMAVLFVLHSPAVNGFITKDYINVDEDKEYVLIDEEEIVLGDTDFIIKSMSSPVMFKDREITYITLELQSKIKGFI